MHSTDHPRYSQLVVCCSVLQCVAVWCSVVQSVAECQFYWLINKVCTTQTIQNFLSRFCAAVCCSVVQCGTVCCSVVQSVAEC